MAQKNCLFSVAYLGEVAKFSSYRDAMTFAQAVSAADEVVKVEHRQTGVVGQYRAGKPLPGYLEHHAELFGEKVGQ